MQLDAPVAVLVRKICDEWNRAERAIKISEHIIGEDPFPPIKELRYSGRRVVEALQAIDANKDTDYVCERLQDAYFDCLRAKHDAIDLSVSEIAGRIRFAQEDLNANSVIEAFPKFPNLIRSMIGIENRIGESREKREIRDQVYEEIQSDFEEILSLYQEFQANEKLMMAIADARFKAEQRSSNVSSLFSIFSIAAVTALFASLLLDIEAYSSLFTLIQSLLGVED